LLGEPARHADALFARPGTHIQSGNRARTANTPTHRLQHFERYSSASAAKRHDRYRRSAHTPGKWKPGPYLEYGTALLSGHLALTGASDAGLWVGVDGGWVKELRRQQAGVLSSDSGHERIGTDSKTVEELLTVPGIRV